MGLDAEKIPDRPVSYKCPGCQGRIVVDKQRLLAGGGTGEAVTDSTDDAPRPDSSPERLDLPPGATLPHGFLVVEEEGMAGPIREHLEPLDCRLESLASAERARQRTLVEPPPLVVYAAGSVGKPPYDPLSPLTSLPPRERRAVFLALVASNVKTLDGNLAFLFGVDLLVNQKDLGRLPAALYEAMRYHHRLYRSYLTALEAL
jgi:hypothetical protein